MKKYTITTQVKIPETRDECEAMKCEDCGIDIIAGDKPGCHLYKFLQKAEVAK